MTIKFNIIQRFEGPFRYADNVADYAAYILHPLEAVKEIDEDGNVERRLFQNGEEVELEDLYAVLAGAVGPELKRAADELEESKKSDLRFKRLAESRRDRNILKGHEDEEKYLALVDSVSLSFSKTMDEYLVSTSPDLQALVNDWNRCYDIRELESIYRAVWFEVNYRSQARNSEVPGVRPWVRN